MNSLPMFEGGGVVGRSLPHDSAHGHVTGGAMYLDDLPAMGRELWVEVLASPTARGLITRLDVSGARGIPGVVMVATARDIPGKNLFGGVICDEPILATERVHYVGQPVAAVAAETPEAARAAIAAMVLEVEAEPPVLTIEQALARGEFIGVRRRIARGDAHAAISSAPHQLSGEFHIGGQEQFYFESQVALAIPGEDGAVVVHSSTQNPTEGQHVIAEALGLHMHQVIIICKRMGGGFGGKETQAVIPSVLAALVAHRTGRPARIVYTKDDDMKRTGKRHDYLARYTVGFDERGVLRGAAFEFHSNGGAFADLSTAVLERTMLHAENAYYIGDIEIEAHACRTNLPPNTAFRGFGGPQGVACIEAIMEEIARHLGMDSLDVRRRNLYGQAPRNVAPYGQIITENTLPEIFETLTRTADYRARAAAVATFNATSRTHLRGLSMTAVKFGIAFTASFLNQGNALVNVYFDGTVQVSTGATEMGQGVNTKIRQIVADEFGLPIDAVTVMATSTEKNINTAPTAASAGTDLNGAAARKACQIIKDRTNAFAASLFASAERGLRYAPEHVVYRDGFVFDERAPDLRLTFHDFTNRCRLARVDLGARGFFATPGVDFNRDTGKGHPFFYYTKGAAVAEVLIDRFTGDLRVERVDLLMDIGRMINPGVDRGQVIGAFIQGQGWCTTEKLVYTPRGELLSHSPTTYKIPGIDDVPPVFNVAFLDNGGNTKNICASKAVGEPPLLLGVCVWTAARHALRHLDTGSPVDLTLPATGEELLRSMTNAARVPSGASCSAPM